MHVLLVKQTSLVEILLSLHSEEDEQQLADLICWQTLLELHISVVQTSLSEGQVQELIHELVSN